MHCVPTLLLAHVPTLPFSPFCLSNLPSLNSQHPNKRVQLAYVAQEFVCSGSTANCHDSFHSVMTVAHNTKELRTRWVLLP